MGTSGLPSETHFTPPLTERGRALPPFLAPSEAYRKQIYDNTLADLELRGWEAASVIYMLPWSLSLDGPAHQERKIPGVPLDEKVWKEFFPRLKLKGGLSIPYIHYPVLNPYISVGTGFQGPNITESQPLTSAHVSYPIQLADDVVQQTNRHESQGGVFCYRGIHKPFEQEKTKEQEIHLAEEAFRYMSIHLDRKLRQAEEAFLTQHKEQLREVTIRNGWAVQYMLNAGMISQPPKWYTERRQTSREVSTKCENCGNRVSSEANACSCGYVLRPYEAYGKAYTEETPGGMMTARRMTKTQLELLGLYPRIKPHSEWLAEQNKIVEEQEKERKRKKE